MANSSTCALAGCDHHPRVLHKAPDASRFGGQQDVVDDATWTDESSNSFTAFGSYAVTGLWATSWSGIIPCFSEGHLYCVETP